AGGVDDRVVAQAALLGYVRQDLAQVSSRVDQLSQEAARNAQLAQHVGGERPGRWVIKLRGAGDGSLRALNAGQEIVQQIRHEQEFGGIPQQLGGALGDRVQLVQRVDLHELCACVREDLLLRNDAEHLLRNAVSSRIAIVTRVLNQRPVGAEQAEVHAPGVDGNTIQPVNRFCGGANSFAGLMKQPEGIPVEAVRQTNRRVWKAVEFFEVYGVVGERGKHCPPAFGTQVQGQVTA